MENTIPLASYRAQYPARFSLLDDDKLVLHGGGGLYRVEIADNSATQTLDFDFRLQNLNGCSVSVYVLNQCLVLWINESNIGIDIPYTLIALHALKELQEVTVLYLQLLSCDILRCYPTVPNDFTQTLELIIREDPNSSYGQVSPLFTHNSNIKELYSALSACSALHFDSESESDAENGSDLFSPSHEWITADSDKQPHLEVPTGWLNVGDADDLEAEVASGTESGGEAGMNVTLVSGQIAGVIRRRNSKSGERQKIRRLDQ